MILEITFASLPISNRTSDAYRVASLFCLDSAIYSFTMEHHCPVVWLQRLREIFAATPDEVELTDWYNIFVRHAVRIASADEEWLEMLGTIIARAPDDIAATDWLQGMVVHVMSCPWHDVHSLMTYYLVVVNFRLSS